MNRKFLSLIIALLMLAMVVPVSAQDEELVFPVGEGDFSWADLEAFQAMDFSGEELTVSSPWISEDAKLVESIFAYFEYATGVDIVHSGSDSFEQQIIIDLEAGSPPNIAVFPQPGLAADAAAKGFLTPLGEETEAWLLENYSAGQSWVDLSTFPDENGDPQLFVFPYKTDLKSIVWYLPSEFEANGWEVPTTFEELQALTEEIAAGGETAWCIGIGSGDATGWPATDWVEDLMLRLWEPEVYDLWTSHGMPFDDERVVEAIETFGWFAKNEAYVNGGPQAVATSDFRENPNGLFEVPPQCYMHRMASFISSYFPEGTELGVDVDFFYFPAYAEKDLGTPVLGAGTLWSITDDNEITRAFFEFLKTPLANELWMAQSGFLTPHTGANPALYADDILRAQGEILLNATTFRFDGSDLMPGRIGAGAFWTGMVDYVSSDMSAADVAAQIEEVWAGLEE
jgi:alpha-glucoside transport system substrate-binding protein